MIGPADNLMPTSPALRQEIPPSDAVSPAAVRRERRALRAAALERRQRNKDEIARVLAPSSVAEVTS